MHLRIQIPALDEAKTIRWVLERSIEAGRDLIGCQRISECSLLLIDDGSQDGTADRARDFARQAPELALIRHPEPRGLGRSFREGWQRARRDAVDILVHVDADGQFDPLDLPRLVHPVLDDGVDLALGSRAAGIPPRPSMALVDRFGNWMFAQLVSALGGQRIRDVSCGFRAFSGRAIRALELKGDFTYTHETVLRALWAGLSVREVPVPVRGRRAHGRSRIARSRLRYGLEAGRVIVQTISTP